MSNLFQDKNTGKLVEFINKHDKEYAMVRDAGGNITYVNIESLVPYDKEKGRLSKVTAPQVAPEPEEKLPESVVPVEDTRLNLNTAKRIVELRMSLSGERFANLKQLENIPRVNWEQLIEEDLIFIS